MDRAERFLDRRLHGFKGHCRRRIAAKGSCGLDEDVARIARIPTRLDDRLTHGSHREPDAWLRYIIDPAFERDVARAGSNRPSPTVSSRNDAKLAMKGTLVSTERSRSASGSVKSGFVSRTSSAFTWLALIADYQAQNVRGLAAGSGLLGCGLAALKPEARSRRGTGPARSSAPNRMPPGRPKAPTSALSA